MKSLIALPDVPCIRPVAQPVTLTRGKVQNFQFRFQKICFPVASNAGKKDGTAPQGNETSPPATRESARASFVPSPTVTRGPRGQTGAIRSRRRCARAARLSLIVRQGPIRRGPDSRYIFLLEGNPGGLAIRASTSAHRLAPLEPQASKRHDVPDLRRRATREQRGRPEHPNVEPSGESFAIRYLTHVTHDPGTSAAVFVVYDDCDRTRVIIFLLKAS